MYYIKIKKPVHQKEKKFILKRMKKQTIEWKKYITIHLWTKDLPKYVKTSKSRKGQNTNRKMDKIFEQTFT